VVDQWLAGLLPATHPAWQLLREAPKLDPWGNPYRCTRNIVRKDGSRVAIGIYSTGRDEVSVTSGNDPDDLNSWDEGTGKF
jgi:hypothetical protein